MQKKYLVEKTRKLLAEKKKAAAKNAVIMRWRRRPEPQPSRPTPAPMPTPSPVVKPIEYMFNDPLSTDLVGYITSPPTPPSQSPFIVKGYKGGGYNRGSVEYQAANVYVTVSETLNVFNSSLAEIKVPRWRRTSSLNILPRAGVDLNAFYDGRALQFFYASSPKIGGSVFTADSADIVSHECGHGILDCYRPDLWNAAFIEAGAFHESFGDICSILHALQHDQMINKALAETGGDLSKSNVISRLAEQFGRAIYKLNSVGKSPDYLRDAVNSFKYVDPGTLPTDTPDNMLSSEVHNFSRVFTGAVYDMLVAIYNKAKKTIVNPIDAVKLARDTVCHYMINAINNAPLNARFYESMAKTILWADANVNAGKYQNELQQVFEARNMIGLRLSILSAPKSPNCHNIVKDAKNLSGKLSDVCVQAMAGEYNDLYDVQLDMPANEVHLYDAKGNFHNCVLVTEEETFKAAQDFVYCVHKTGAVGPDSRTPWEVREGKLVRTRTCCCHLRR